MQQLSTSGRYQRKKNWMHYKRAKLGLSLRHSQANLWWPLVPFPPPPRPVKDGREGRCQLFLPWAWQTPRPAKEKQASSSDLTRPRRVKGATVGSKVSLEVARSSGQVHFRIRLNVVAVQSVRARGPSRGSRAGSGVYLPLSEGGLLDGSEKEEEWETSGSARAKVPPWEEGKEGLPDAPAMPSCCSRQHAASITAAAGNSRSPPRRGNEMRKWFV